MGLWLQIILAVVLLAVSACLIPVLLQLLRTARSVELLAESARVDLQQITADVHHLRERADGLADLAAANLEMPLGVGRVMTGALQGLQAVLGGSGFSWASILLTGVKYFMNMIRRPKKPAATKEAPHE